MTEPAHYHLVVIGAGPAGEKGWEKPLARTAGARLCGVVMQRSSRGPFYLRRTDPALGQ